MNAAASLLLDDPSYLNMPPHTPIITSWKLRKRHNWNKILVIVKYKAVMYKIETKEKYVQHKKKQWKENDWWGGGRGMFYI